ncbi:glycosyltransferase [Cellulomonas composti]|uniref:glycosyltransferase n=1 Tax=Cellulomonas composti TaxID=266130 RepID=UPI0011BFCA6C|nr:glycosyltransferase [Cellulomonas composti]
MTEPEDAEAVQEVPAQEVSAQEASAQEAPEQEAPAQEVPESEVPVVESPSPEAPVLEAPAPLISVVVPTHDVGLWIDECLTSILVDQDVPLEVIVVDDDSKDDTWERLTAWAARDPRVRALRAPGVGGGQARNFGVEQARGPWLAFADGDDLIPRGAYAAMLAAARESGSDLVVGDFLKFSALQTWSPTARWTGFADRRSGVTLAEHPTLVRNRACWNRLFRADFWRESGIAFPSVPRSNDVVPMISALVAARSIDVVPDVVYLYRDRPGGTSMTAQASSEVAVVSYLSQELLCARLLGAVGQDQIDAAYWPMVLDSDGWVHLRRFVLSRDEDVSPSDSSEVPALLGELLAMRRERAFVRLAPEKQVVYALATLGRARWARDVLAAYGDGDLEPAPMDPVEVMRAALAADETGWLLPATMQTFVHTRVIEAIAALSVPLSRERAEELVELAASRPQWFAEPIGAVERPHDTVIRLALHTGAAQPLTEVVAGPDAVALLSLTVRNTVAHLVLDLPAPTRGRASVTLHAYKPGRPETLRGVARVRFDDGAWRANVSASALVSEGTWSLEVWFGDDESAVQVPLEVDRDVIRLEHGRLGLMTVRGKARGVVPATLFRRASPPRRVLRALRRRR